MSATLETLQKPFDLHVLICTNTRPDPAKQSCGPMGAENLRAELKLWLKSELQSRPKLASETKVRVNGSGCLDFCKKGIAVAIYPQSEFVLFVKNTPESIQELKDKIVATLNDLEMK